MRSGPLRRVLRLALLAVLALGVLGCVRIPDDKVPQAWRQDKRREVDDWRAYEHENLMDGDAWFYATGTNRHGVIKGYGSGPAWFDSQGGYFELSVISRRENVPVRQSVRVYFDDETRVTTDKGVGGTVLAGIARGQGYNVTEGNAVLEVPFYVNGGRMYATEVKAHTDQRVIVP